VAFCASCSAVLAAGERETEKTQEEIERHLPTAVLRRRLREQRAARKGEASEPGAR
jgi:hypothetical protein